MSRVLFPVLILGFVASLGCLKRSAPVVFHTLRPLAQIGEMPAANTMAAVAMEVVPVRLPEALQRPQLVTALGPGTLELSDTHRWGNGLDKDMQRVLVENLSALLGNESVVAFPYGGRVKAGLRLEVDVLRCDGRPGGILSLRATWMVTRLEGGPALLRKQITLDEPVAGQDLEALATAHSRIMEKLSRDIAEGMKTGALR